MEEETYNYPLEMFCWSMAQIVLSVRNYPKIEEIEFFWKGAASAHKAHLDSRFQLKARDLYNAVVEATAQVRHAAA